MWTTSESDTVIYQFPGRRPVIINPKDTPNRTVWTDIDFILAELRMTNATRFDDVEIEIVSEHSSQ